MKINMWELKHSLITPLLLLLVWLAILMIFFLPIAPGSAAVEAQLFVVPEEVMGSLYNLGDYLIRGRRESILSHCKLFNFTALRPKTNIQEQAAQSGYYPPQVFRH